MEAVRAQVEEVLLGSCAQNTKRTFAQVKTGEPPCGLMSASSPLRAAHSDCCHAWHACGPSSVSQS